MYLGRGRRRRNRPSNMIMRLEWEDWLKIQGEAYLAQQPEDLEAAAVDFERWRAREAVETAP